MSVPTWAEKLIVQHQGEDALSQKWAGGVQNGEMGYLEAMKLLNKYFVFVVGNKSPKQTLALLTFRTLESGDTLVEAIHSPTTRRGEEAINTCTCFMTRDDARHKRRCFNLINDPIFHIPSTPGACGSR